MEQERLRAIVDGYADRLVEDLTQLINIPSVSGNTVEVDKALYRVLERAKELGFRANSLLGGKVGLIEAGPSESGCETLGILAHVDVVPPGELDQWHSPPFSAAIRDGAVWGRGALDDKGPLLASLYALKAVTELGRPLKKRVQIILGTQEETEWSDIHEYCNNYLLPDYGFTPDGEFPLCNIEKGSADIVVTIPLEADAAQSNMPQTGGGQSGTKQTDLRSPVAKQTDAKQTVISIFGGTATNIVPDRCTAVLEELRAESSRQFTLEAGGRAAHSCQPEKGDNAILNMCRLLAEKKGLADNTLRRAAVLLLECCEDVCGSGMGISSPTEYYNGEFVHRNTFSPTLIRTEGNQLLISFNVRFPYGVEKQELLDAFSQFADRLGGFARVAAWMPAVYIPKDKPFMKAFGKAYETATGRPDELALAYGGSYAKAMPNIASWGPLFPEETDTCHEANENITVESLMFNTRIFAEALRIIALSDESFK